MSLSQGHEKTPAPAAPSAQITRDALFQGALVFEQPVDGYRVNVDAVLLAWFAGSSRNARRACDLGAGVGAVGLSLLHLGTAEHVTFVEADPRTSELSLGNAKMNGFASRCVALPLDVREFAATAPGAFDLVVTNPPYTAVGSGRLPQSSARARATVGDLSTFIAAVRKLVGARGRACISYPAQSSALLFCELAVMGLAPKRARFVHAMADKPARIVLVEAQPGKPGGLSIMPPLVERKGGALSEELERLFRAPRVLRPSRAATP